MEENRSVDGVGRDDVLAPGSTIGGCTVVETLAEGGSGTVYLVHQTSLGRKVALKLSHAKLSGMDERTRERMRWPGAIMARLNHPNVVAIYDEGEHEDRVYWAMELVDGRTLAEIVRDDGPLPAPDLLKLAGSVAWALGYAHGEQIVHSAVRPGNVMVTSAGRPVLIGFDEARPADAGPAAECTDTDPSPYVSPEQARRMAGTPLSDIWGLGATMYEALSGAPPFAGDTTPELLERIASPEPVDMSPVEGRAPDSVADIVARCLKKDPAERYQTAEEVKHALEAAGDRMRKS